MHYPKLSQAVQPLTRFKARKAGIQLGQRNHISLGGKYFISDHAKVVLGDEVLLGRDHRVEVFGNSEIHIGSRVRFHDRVRIQAVDGARIYIADDCFFDHDIMILSHDSIVIGSNGLFAAFCYLSDHNHKTERSTLISTQGFDTEPLIIGADVWLGVGATLIKGANLGEGAVIAARSVVNKSVPPYEIWGGVPAKKLSERK